MIYRTFQLNKLVRDKIVEFNKGYGAKVEHKTLAGTELNYALVTKLIEEAKELLAEELSVGEIADLQEIIDQLCENLGITKEDLVAAQKAKRDKNGGFKEGHFIGNLSLPEDNEWVGYYAQEPDKYPEVE